MQTSEAEEGEEVCGFGPLRGNHFDQGLRRGAIRLGLVLNGRQCGTAEGRAVRKLPLRVHPRSESRFNISLR